MSAAAGGIVVATYNIHRTVGRDGRHDPERIGAVLRELDADVVALQELEWRAGAALERMCRCAGDLQYLAVAGPTLVVRGGHYGNVLLTRLAVLKVERIDLSQPGHEPRGALDVTLAAGGERLRIIATHLGLRPWEINEWFLWGRPLRWLHAYFGDTPAAPTFPATLPLFALDRIWIHPRSRLRRIEVHTSALARMASDHLPLRAVMS